MRNTIVNSASAVVRGAPVALGLFFLLTANASAQKTDNNEERKRQANAHLVTIVGSTASSTYTRFAEDIQNVFDEAGRDGVRVLPMLGRGGGQNFNDILLVKGIDVATTDADYLRYYQKQNPALYANAHNQIQYIAKLFNAEFHLLVPRSIKSVRDLRGKKVNFFKPASISAMTAEMVFGTLGIEVVPTHFDHALALQKLRSGEIAGAVRTSGAPNEDYAGITAADGFHLLAVDEQTAPRGTFKKLMETYLPAQLTHEQYPQLIAPGATVRTVASSIVLAVYGWPEESERYKTLAKFVTHLFDNIDKFAGPARHPKWRDINLQAAVPGWTRFKPAQEWLDTRVGRLAQVGRDDAKVAFERFSAEYSKNRPPLTQVQQDMLFQEFLGWWKSKGARVTRN